jgi:tetratricopeptide (TPR) repeat protein
MQRRASAIAAAVLLLATPAQAVTGDLAAYMRARVADADGATAAAARDYAVALAADADSPEVAVRAYREAIRAGDLALADRAAAALGPNAPADAALLALAKAAQGRDAAASHAALARIDAGQFRLFAAPLRAWSALDAGTDPLAPLAQRPTDAVARRFAEETRALVLLARGDTAGGLAALRPLLGNDQAAQDNRLFAARLLIAQGKTDAARALLVGDAPAIVALRARADDRAAGIKPSLAAGASHLFARVASDLALGAPGPVGYALLRAALRADPSNDRARLLLAGALARDGATDQAVAVLGEVPPDSIHAAAAATGRVQVLAGAGRDAEALAAAKASGATSDGDLSRLADLYLRLDRPAEAVPLYRTLVARAGDSAGWAEWLQLGAALDLAGDWKAARPALERALTLGPEQPLVLNQLGYALIEHQQELPRAQAMLEKAARLEPNDAAITDSLGWAYFRRGDTDRALPLIERAAVAEPTNAEIAEHLGDVYWRAGRRFEARYAWTAAREMGEAEDVRRLAGKIANGL